MKLRWLKPYLPRGLFGRAALSLLVPIVTLVLVATVVILQRHFEGVTKQMTFTMAREIELVRNSDDPGIAEALGIGVRGVSAAELPARDVRKWYDLSGIVIAHELRDEFSDLQRIMLIDDATVELYFEADDGYLVVDFPRRHVSARRPYLLFVNLLGTGVLMTVIAYIYLRKQLRPITLLARAAEAFGRGRHVPYRASGALEVRTAGNAFLDMRSRIERQIEQRTLLLSGVSHDLRTPLTRLRLGLAMLDDAEAEPMLRDVEDMQRLLDAFMDFARGVAEAEPEPVDPMALVVEVIEDAQRAELPVVTGSMEGAGEVPLRRFAIKRAVENLVGNAVRYGHRAEVSVWLSERSLRIRVEDDGPGIPPERREEAMKPFTRLDPARNQDGGSGVGLGLAIVMDIARAHGGVVRLGESARLGGLQADIVIGR
jgi:two-component system osmolarity sensor histidine kinase EnvZ